jgi:tetratricopeptide (TPR) repeat protein
VSQIGLLLRLYVRPLSTFSRIIDEARLLFAVIAALAAMLALQIPRSAEYYRQAAAGYSRIAKAREAAIAAHGRHPVRPSQADGDGEGDEIRLPGPPGPPRIQVAVDEFTARAPMQYFRAPAALAIAFVPAAIFILTLWGSLGGFSTILFRDYMTLLVCSLMAWTAAYLPLAVVNGSLLYLQLPLHDHPALWWAAHLYFLGLTSCAIRTLFGTGFGRAAAATAGAWVGAVGGLWLQWIFGGMASWLASPFVLYYLWSGLKPEIGSLGVGLRSRQRLKQQLENATLNPRDADAHYQLGLIYQQRRQNSLAQERFLKAIEIDPSEPDAYYQRGRMAHAKGEYEAALRYYQAAARIDDKHCSSEVWREIGVAHLQRGRPEEAKPPLERYLNRRPFDPEGQTWYGRVLVKLGLPDAATQAFQQAIEAVRTMPPARKRQVHAWAGQAEKELRALRKSAQRPSGEFAGAS